MFGLKKSASTSSSAAPFSIQEFFIQHIEKLVFGFFVLFTGYLIYEGIGTTSYEASKTPDDLTQKAASVKKEIVDGDHWNQIKEDRAVNPDYEARSVASREPTNYTPYSVDRFENSMRDKGGLRGDPEILAPLQLQGTSFFGPVAYLSQREGAVSMLKEAPAVTEDRKRGGRTIPTSTKERKLDAKYDNGFVYVPGAKTKDTAAEPTSKTPARTTRASESVSEGSLVAKLQLFTAVTAAVPHELILDSYTREFENASGYQPERDSPNYLGFEVQRVEVTSNVDAEPTEDQWQDAKECYTEAQLRMSDLWAGDCEEVAEEDFVVEKKLTMGIPPVLLAEYRDFASHPLIPVIKKVVTESSGPGGGYGGGGSGYGGQPGTPATYGGTPAGYGAGYGGGQSGPGQAAKKEEEDPKLVPKAEKKSEYKLLRFFDFGVRPGKVYRYRTRIVLEDPNFPRLESYAPRTKYMKPEVVARIQELIAKDKILADKTPAGKKHTRESRLESPWSSPSGLIAVNLPTEFYASTVEGIWSPMKSAAGDKTEVMVETLPAKGVCVYGEWDPALAVLVPKRLTVERGSILSGPMTESWLDVIDPTTKLIKLLSSFEFKDPVTIADLRGGQPLAAEKRPGSMRDDLKAGGEIVGYDPRNGELVIGREFYDWTPYRMYSFEDEYEAANATSSSP